MHEKQSRVDQYKYWCSERLKTTPAKAANRIRHTIGLPFSRQVGRLKKNRIKMKVVSANQCYLFVCFFLINRDRLVIFSYYTSNA